MPNHLIHIGYPKAASTFLQEWFSQHPQLHFTQVGIAGFQDAFEICRYASGNFNSFPAYFVTSTEYFSYPHASAGKNIPPQIADRDFYKYATFRQAQKKTCNTLKKLFPDSKILIVTRGFREVLMSGYSQFIQSSGSVKFPEFCEFTEKNIDEFFNYNYLIDLYIQYFGKDNVIVLPFEMLKKSQSHFLSHLEQILELDHFECKIEALNRSLSAHELYWHSMISYNIAEFFLKFGNKAYQKFYIRSVRLLRNRCNKLLKFTISRLPERNIDPENLSENIVQKCGKQATILKNFPVFKPYLSDYNLSSDDSYM